MKTLISNNLLEYLFIFGRPVVVGLGIGAFVLFFLDGQQMEWWRFIIFPVGVIFINDALVMAYDLVTRSKDESQDVTE